MTEVERVKGMLAEGKITADEAARLISVLEEVGEVERELEAVGDAADRAVPSDRNEGELSPARARSASEDVGGWPAADRWVQVSMLAGDLDVRLDETIAEPVVRSSGDGGDVAVEPAGDGFRISQFGGGGDFLERLIDGFRKGDLEVRLPPGYSLGLDIKAGDVTVRDIPYLRGSVLAGDLDASGLLGVDITMQAGDIDLELAPTSGHHKVRVSAGDMKIGLHRNSSVAVSGRVSIGEARVVGGAASQRSGLGASLSTTVGAGDASLDLQLATGSLTLKVHDE